MLLLEPLTPSLMDSGSPYSTLIYEICTDLVLLQNDPGGDAAVRKAACGLHGQGSSFNCNFFDRVPLVIPLDEAFDSI